MHQAKAYSPASATSPLAGTTIPRRDPGEHDLQIEILFCGICHSDLHSVRNEWSEFMTTTYPDRFSRYSHGADQSNRALHGIGSRHE